MLKYTKYILGATLMSIGTLTVVYAGFPTKSDQDKSNFVLITSEKVKLNDKSETLLAEKQIKNSTDIVLNIPPQVVQSSDEVFDFVKGLWAVVIKTDAIPVGQARKMDTVAAIASPIQNGLGLKDQNLKPIIQANAENFSIIKASYATNLQVAQEQKTEKQNKMIVYNIYAGVRRNLTYTNTFINTREKPGVYKQVDKLQSQAKIYLKKNIEELSDYQKLKQEFTKKIIYSRNITPIEKKYANNILEIIDFMEQNKINEEIINIEQQVRRQMIEEQDNWSQEIAQIVENLQTQEERKKIVEKLQKREEVMPVLW